MSPDSAECPLGGGTAHMVTTAASSLDKEKVILSVFYEFSFYLISETRAEKRFHFY